MAEKSQKSGLVGGFMQFISNYGVLPLAIGVVIGTAVNDLVNTLVEGIISPLIALVMPADSLSGYTLTVSGSEFKIGAFADGLLNFVIVALVVYVVVKALRRSDIIEKK